MHFGLLLATVFWPKQLFRVYTIYKLNVTEILGRDINIQKNEPHWSDKSW